MPRKDDTKKVDFGNNFHDNSDSETESSYEYDTESSSEEKPNSKAKPVSTVATAKKSVAKSSTGVMNAGSESSDEDDNDDDSLSYSEDDNDQDRNSAKAANVGNPIFNELKRISDLITQKNYSEIEKTLKQYEENPPSDLRVIAMMAPMRTALACKTTTDSTRTALGMPTQSTTTTTTTTSKPAATSATATAATSSTNTATSTMNLAQKQAKLFQLLNQYPLPTNAQLSDCINGMDLNFEHGDLKETPLVTAIKKNCTIEIILMLIKNGADVNMRGQFNFTPLYVAVENGNKTLVQTLLQEGAGESINEKCTGGALVQKSPLEYATDKNMTGIVGLLKRELAKQSTGTAATSATNAATSSMSVAQRQERLIGMFKDRGLLITQAMIDERVAGLDLNFKFGDLQETPLVTAILHKLNFDLLEYFISKGMDVNMPGENGWTPLFAAVAMNDVLSVKELLKKGAGKSMNVKCKRNKYGDGITPLELAGQSTNYWAKQDILSAFEEEASRQQAIAAPAQTQPSPVNTKTLAQKQAELLQMLKQPAGTTHNQKVLDYIIAENMYDLNFQYGDLKETPLVTAVEYNQQVELITYLSIRGADVNMRGQNGLTPLYVAVEKSNVDLVKELLSKGAAKSINEKCRNFINPQQPRSPLEYARMFGQTEIIALLEKALGIQPTKPVAATSSGTITTTSITSLTSSAASPASVPARPAKTTTTTTTTITGEGVDDFIIHGPIPSEPRPPFIRFDNDPLADDNDIPEFMPQPQHPAPYAQPNNQGEGVRSTLRAAQAMFVDSVERMANQEAARYNRDNDFDDSDISNDDEDGVIVVHRGNEGARRKLFENDQSGNSSPRKTTFSLTKFCKDHKFMCLAGAALFAAATLYACRNTAIVVACKNFIQSKISDVISR